MRKEVKTGMRGNEQGNADNRFCIGTAEKVQSEEEIRECKSEKEREGQMDEERDAIDKYVISCEGNAYGYHEQPKPVRYASALYIHP